MVLTLPSSLSMSYSTVDLVLENDMELTKMSMVYEINNVTNRMLVGKRVNSTFSSFSPSICIGHLVGANIVNKPNAVKHEILHFIFAEQRRVTTSGKFESNMNSPALPRGSKKRFDTGKHNIRKMLEKILPDSCALFTLAYK